MAEDFVTVGVTQKASHDLYYTVHKGIRLMHGRVLERVATCDVADRQNRLDLAKAVRQHLTICRSHLEHENAAIHSAIEARLPGSSDTAAHEHDDHEKSLAELDALVQALLTADPVSARNAQRALYRRFALFVAHDFEHMDGEEYELQPILQANFSDSELRDIEHQIVSNIPPEEMTVWLRAMLGAASTPERQEMLDGMKAGMPAEVFQGAIASVLGAAWTDGDWKAFDRL